MALEATGAEPLLVVGSGGSLSVAHFAAYLHQRYTGRLARATTPLEAVALESVANCSVLVISAGGRNPDVIGALQTLVRREPRHFLVLTATKGSRLGKIAGKFNYVDVIEFEPPGGRDGFLATNTLLAFAILLARSFCSTSSTASPPRTMRDLVHPERMHAQYESFLRKACYQLWEKEALLVLHGAATHPAAIDLESKFSEAALGPVQITDYRNFAHGRHHWLAKRGSTTGVLALVSDEDREIADRTLTLLPADTTFVEIRLPQRAEWATVSAFVSVMHLVGLAGIARGIDPGRPGVPAFGRKIYNLNVWRDSRREPLSWSPKVQAIQRKVRFRFTTVPAPERAAFERAFDHFVAKLRAQRFCSLVLDYDGTLCGKQDRFTGVRPRIAVQLNRILAAGIWIGIATGRGRSVKQDLRSFVLRRLWGKVLVGYYNGGDIGTLDDDSHPLASIATHADLTPVITALQQNRMLAQLADSDPRPVQLTVVPKCLKSWDEVWNTVQHTVASLGQQGVRVVRSSHSMDVLAPGVSKRNLVHDLNGRLKRYNGDATLCIGDLGRWPGNDFELLAEEYSLSVDEVPFDPLGCWNVAPAGHRGVQATLDYLRALRISKSGYFRVDLNALGLS